MDSNAPATNQATVTRVVTFLGAIAIVGLLGLVVLLLADKPSDAVALVGTITGTAVGSLGTLLASTRSVDVAGLQQLADGNAQPPAPVPAAPVADPPAG